jgi:hypothetical protein
MERADVYQITKNRRGSLSKTISWRKKRNARNHPLSATVLCLQISRLLCGVTARLDVRTRAVAAKENRSQKRNKRSGKERAVGHTLLSSSGDLTEKHGRIDISTASRATAQKPTVGFFCLPRNSVFDSTSRQHKTTP